MNPMHNKRFNCRVAGWTGIGIARNGSMFVDPEGSVSIVTVDMETGHSIVITTTTTCRFYSVVHSDRVG